MDEVYGSLTVFFEDPFWVGVFQRTEGGQLSACRVVFGAQPTEQQVYGLVLARYHRLDFSPGIAAAPPREAANPKRRQRQARQEQQSAGAGTRSQQALSLQREAQAIQRRQADKARREEARRRHFDQKQQKRREKHKGH